MDRAVAGSAQALLIQRRPHRSGLRMGWLFLKYTAHIPLGIVGHVDPVIENQHLAVLRAGHGRAGGEQYRVLDVPHLCTVGGNGFARHGCDTGTGRKQQGCAAIKRKRALGRAKNLLSDNKSRARLSNAD